MRTADDLYDRGIVSYDTRLVTAYSCDAMAEKCKITLATDIAKTSLETYDSSSPGNV